MPYITCRQKKTRHKVHISVCENCKGMICPDYYHYLQLSLFPRLLPDEKVRRKFKLERKPANDRPASKPPRQMSWLENPDFMLPRS